MLNKTIIQYIVIKDYEKACWLCKKTMAHLNCNIRDHGDYKNGLLEKEKIRVMRLWEYAYKKCVEESRAQLEEAMELWKDSRVG